MTQIELEPIFNIMIAVVWAAVGGFMTAVLGILRKQPPDFRSKWTNRAAILFFTAGLSAAAVVGGQATLWYLGEYSWEAYQLLGLARVGVSVIIVAGIYCFGAAIYNRSGRSHPLVAIFSRPQKGGEKGDKGDRGDTGPRGPHGDRGPRGDKGKRGDRGKRGKEQTC